MRKTASLLIVILSVALIFSGCSSSPQASAPAATTAAAQSAAPATASPATAENTPASTTTAPASEKYDPAITMEFVRSYNDTLEKEIATLNAKDGETLDNNRWTQVIEKELGIKVTYRWWAKGDQYAQKLKMAMASSDLPDSFCVNDLTDIQQLAQAGVIQELGPSYDSTASAALKQQMEADGMAPFNQVTFNGKLYAIPLVMPTLDTYSYIWIRSDWLKKLNLPQPATTDELLSDMEAFGTADFDKNGKKDTYGMVIDKDLWYSSSGFFWGFGAYPQHWVDINGALAYGATQPAMKTALQALHKLYEDGLIDPEFGTKDGSKAKEMAVNGRCGVIFGGHWETFTLAATLKTDPDADWISIPLPTATGSPTIGALNPNCEGYQCVKSTFAHPEALVKLFNLFQEKVANDFATYYAATDNTWKFCPVFTLDPHNNVTAYQQITKAVQDGTTDKLSGVGKGYYTYMQDPDPTTSWEWNKMFGKGDTPMKVLESVVNNKLYFINSFVGAPTPTLVDRGSALDELRNSTVTKIILGELDVDTGFSQFLTEWNNLGGAKVTQEVNDWYSQQKK